MVDSDPGPAVRDAARGRARDRAVRSSVDGGPWGVLLLASPASRDPDRLGARAAPDRRGDRRRATSSAAAAVGGRRRAPAPARRCPAPRHERHRQPAGSRRDPRAASSTTRMVLFSADRVAVLLFEEDGRRRMAASRGLSQAWTNAAVRRSRAGRLGPGVRSPPGGRCSPSTTRDDPRAGDLRAAVIQEGFDTACIAPLLDGSRPEPLGHPGRLSRHGAPLDRGRARDDGRPRDAGRASPSRPPRTYAQLATWAAQLQSIQAARRPAQPPDQRAGDRRRDRDRAAPADRLSQRPRLPAGRRRSRPGGDAGPGRRVPRRDPRAAQDPGRRRDHRLGRRAPRRPAAR